MADSDKRLGGGPPDAGPAREEEFYYLLTEGSELLQAGKVDDARVHFERALEMNPNHEQALNLLGLSLFRLSKLDRARQIFADLVHNNPIEPSLRLNLAMVHLKTGRLDEAKIELERVLELSPDHPRATSYMGLVAERQGDLERAANYYERAGNKKRADEIRAYRPTATGTYPLPNLQRMIQEVQAQKLPAPAPAQAPPSEPRPAEPPRPAPASRAPTPAPSLVPTGNPAAKTSVGAQAAALTAATAAQLKRSSEPPGAAAVENARGSSLGFTLEVQKDGEARDGATTKPTSASAPQQAPPPAPQGGTVLQNHTLADLEAAAIHAPDPVLREDGILAFPIPDVGYVRTDLLVALSGQFEIEQVNRRYRGKRTDSLFGGPDAAMIALLGQGVALLLPDELSIRLMTLKNEELYLVERALLAFTQGIVWENGRLPSESDRDLDIVHLRGGGRLVLGTQSPLLTMQVRPDQPVTVHASRLVGWSGQLVPYRAPLPGLPEAARRIPVVRFEGTGIVLAL